MSFQDACCKADVELAIKYGSAKWADEAEKHLDEWLALVHEYEDKDGRS